MSKSTFLNNSKIGKTDIAFFLVLVMICGFLVSTVMLSISMFLFCVNALWGVPVKRWKENKWWLLGLLWLATIAITYFWSDDKANWERTLQVKLPLLFYPIACGFLPAFSRKQLRWLTLLMGLILMCGVVYSVSFLVRDPAQYIWNYSIAHLLPTPCSQDHVRFSVAIALYVVWCVYVWRYFTGTAMRWAIVTLQVLMVLYLHVLAAKSGLIALYVFLAAWGIYVSIVKRRIAGLVILLAIPVFIWAALKYIPTFSQRKDYTWYAWNAAEQGDKSGHYGDMSRLISFDIAWRLIKEHPIAGVGAGDVMNEMRHGYALWYPTVEDKARLLVHNQFLITGLGCGIPAMIVFAVWVFYPLTWLRRDRKSFFLFVVWLALLTQLLIEPVLEVQFGVFVYFFFLLWFRQGMVEEVEAV